MPSTRIDKDLAYVETGMGRDLDAVLVYNLLKTNSYLSHFIDAGLRQERVTASQFNVLLVLQSAGDEGMLMGAIGERLVVTKSNVTGLIDRMERQGLVVRGRHRDRRATVVRLTKAAVDLLKATLPRHADLLAELSGSLTDTEKRTLVRLHSKLRRALRHRRKGGE
jgi:MarR family 2-MHQ and catechol resistance regulon transcriptional repressor